VRALWLRYGVRKRLAPAPQQGRHTHGPFHPDYVICDAGYFNQEVRQQIKRQCLAEPIIDPNPSQKKALARTPNTRMEGDLRATHGG
jgi:hypothetical protein